MRRWFTAVAIALALIAAGPPPPVRELSVMVPMRDGVRLSANVFRPGGSGRYPTVLLRTPYNKGGDITPNFLSFVNRGYAVVVQDVRGRYESQGRFEPMNQEVRDGDDTLNWIAAQPWSDGAVGMYGGSYLGIAQWKAAISHNPHLKAIFPYVSGDDDYLDRFYSRGGAMKFGHRLLWIADNLRDPDYDPVPFSKFIWDLPVRHADSVAAGGSVGIWQLAADHPSYDRFWKSVSVRERLKDIRVPVYSVGGWYDNYVQSDLEAFATLRRVFGHNRIMVGPWPHTFSTPFAKVNFGKDAIVPLRPEQLEWFDHWLKGREFRTDQPPVRLFVMGANRWRDEQEWPLARAREVKFYLASAGHANTAAGDGALVSEPARESVPDSFVYDPRDPVRTAGGAVCCNNAVFPWGPLDQRAVERRKDVLVYSTPPLVSDVEATGPIKVILYASSSAVDTDFTAKLVDVFPDGEARILCDGIVRARYRDSLETPVLMARGAVYRFTIEVGVTSNVFRAGHRIRVEISSSNFPKYDRNLNTGRPVADEREMRRATQMVFHDRERHSYLLLPVVPSVPAELPSARASRYSAKRASSTQAYASAR